MRLEALPDNAAVAHAGAVFIAREANAAIAARGRFTIALSGGRTPWLMLHALADEDLPWPAMQIFQVDERIAPAGHTDRNLTHIRETLLARAPLVSSQMHPMPVESHDADGGVGQYAATLCAAAGSPPVLDLIHLGLGTDGHAASLIPDDPVLTITDADVAITGLYQGYRRMTLTYPALNRARQILWLVTGYEKAQMLLRLVQGDITIPAGLVETRNAHVLADRAAAGKIK